MAFPARPTQNQDPWFATRDTYDAAIEDELVTLKAADHPLPAGVGPSRQITTTSHGLGSKAEGNHTNPANTLSLMPIYFAKPATAAAIAVTVAGAAVAGGQIQLGIYTLATDTMTMTLLVDAGFVTTDTTGRKSLAISQQVSGWIWVATLTNATITLSGAEPAFALTAEGSVPRSGFEATQTYGALPASLIVSSFRAYNAPIIEVGY